MKCLKGCHIDGERYEPGDELPKVSDKDLRWLVAKGVVAKPKKGK